MHVLHYGLLHYGMLKVLHITSFRSRFDVLKLASHISHVLLWLHRQNGLKRVIGPNEAGITFETISAAAAGRVKTIHRCFASIKHSCSHVPGSPIATNQSFTYEILRVKNLCKIR